MNDSPRTDGGCRASHAPPSRARGRAPGIPVRARRNKKYYPIDTALRRVVVTPAGGDRGKALECAVHLALRRRFGRTYYWRERGEVDFVVQADRRVIPIQVSWGEPAERHAKALEEFYGRFPQAEEAVTITAADWETQLARLVR
ncbi:MAG: ATP-binding protein [Deltaproteobacteria bacterium]|nr:ATP-binding protein [Deltaproteobacteria bacterium]